MTSADDGSPVRTAVLGLCSRRERWGLTLRGWLVLFGIFVGFASVLFFGAYPFLAVTSPVRSNALVVEGWIHEYAIHAAVQEFERGGYSEVFSTGGPVEGIGHYINDFQTSASVGGELLKKYGLPAAKLHVVASRVSDRSRTYSSAIALRDWFQAYDRGLPDALNIMTENLHARRSRLLYQKAFGPKVKIGVIAVPAVDYPASRWWQYSAGVKDLVAEGVGYVYARLFFWP